MDVQPFAVEQKTYYVLRMKDRSLDRFKALVEATLGQDLDFMADLEASNDSEHIVEVKSLDAVWDGNEWDQKQFNDWLQGSGGGYGIVPIVMSHMCHLGHIPAGDYIIYFCW